MCFGPLERVCNWGPLTALAIIKTITLTTLHCTRLQPRLNVLPFIDLCFFIFMVFSGLTLYHFITCMYEGPGFLPINWVPENKFECQFLQFCKICQGYKAPRSHHCRKCGRCILKMDHHCPWINNCVGHNNHGNFTAFLASSVFGCFVSTYIMTNWLISVFSNRNLFLSPPSLFVMVIVLFSIGLSIGVILAVGMLLYFQVVTIIKNQTGIEAWIVEKANYRRTNSKEKFLYPYSKGWLFNVKQVITWNCVPVGNGIYWPVVEGCDQYTLTREQIAQKIEKRQRSRRYRVVTKYSSSWLPLSHGIRVLCSPPFTDEPRIKLEEGDTIVVTRWRKNWLFGEKESTSIPSNGKDTRIRGWFPRICVIEVIEKDCEFDYDFLDDNFDAQEENSAMDGKKPQ